MSRWLSIAILVVACTPQPATTGGGDASVDAAHDGQIRTSNVVVSLTFDDTLADQYQVGAMLASHGMHATFFINSPRVGMASYMTLAQLRELRDAGNEIAGHTLDHIYLTQVDATTAHHEICDDRTALVGMGFDVSSFAYPFGDDNASVEQIVRDCGYGAARSIGGLFTAESCSTYPYTNQVPPVDGYNIRTAPSVAGAVTADTLETYVIDAESHGGGWLPYVFHHVCDACNPASVGPGVLAKFLDRLQARGVRVATVGELSR